MSIQAVAWVLKQKVGDHVAKHVLMCLANYAGEDGENAFPSVARLEKDTELAERTIREKLGWLVDKGFIRFGDQSMSAAYAKRKDRITVCYDFILRGAPGAPRESTGCAAPQNGVQGTAERGAPGAPNPSEIRKRSGEAGAPSKGAPPAEGTLSEKLRARESPPLGRAPDFDSEFSRRFGCTPDQASAKRKPGNADR